MDMGGAERWKWEGWRDGDERGGKTEMRGVERASW